MLSIQLVTENGLQSAFIRYFTRSQFSHVDFVLSDGSLLGARMDGGVKVRPAGYAEFSAKQVMVADVTEEQRHRILSFAYRQLGKPYDKRGIINFFLQRNWRDDDAWFCSELVAAAFEQAGVPLVAADADRVTPRDLTLSLILKPEITNCDLKTEKQ